MPRRAVNDRGDNRVRFRIASDNSMITSEVVRPSYPWMFDIENDPKQLWNIVAGNVWVGTAAVNIGAATFCRCARIVAHWGLVGPHNISSHRSRRCQRGGESPSRTLPGRWHV
jgi:hypothetical protein